MTGVFLQVRLDSSRLPGKALLKLGGRTVTEHALTALWEVPAAVHALLTDRESASVLAPLARKAGFRVYIGSKDDVLARFCGAARHFAVDTIIRATGDNPLVSPELAVEALNLFNARKADYCGLDDIPVGAGVEILRTSCLFEAEQETRDSYDREHVAPRLYKNPGRYKICRQAASRRSFGRITLDTPEDYRHLSGIFNQLYRGERIPLEILYSWLEKNG